MSRRAPPSQRRIPPSIDNNPYQNTTTPFPQNNYGQPYHQHHHRNSDYQKQCRDSLRKGPLNPATPIDVGFSDFSAETTSYDYYYQENGFQHGPLRESRNTDVTFSDDSGSTRLPYFEFDDESDKRYSRNTFSERGSKRPKTSPDNKRTNQIVHSKDLRKVYPNQDNQWDRLYQEIQTPCDNVPVPNVPKRIPTRMSDRPHSSLSSGVTSAIAIVHGCGGKCQTFENVCYFFLQLIFTMGILIGVSLCIAGIVLRKSAARNLQVLVYIGVLLALVSSLLLGIQCNARITARKRRKAIQMAKRAPIPLENLHLRANPLHQQPLMTRNSIKSQRVMHLPQVHSNLTRPLPSRPTDRDSPSMIEEPGIPWWRRKDLNTH
ncbi:uncharacterized protein isoform X2 [Leptinotarsa decemlineata]|uniref:uncharacterized protein isoform X2 n=1 Tax=Leptinotarsa decemlineata TaxID=7539 RepID=UPI003D305F76